MKYRAEVLGTGETKWSTNLRVFDSKEEAHQWLLDLADRWFGFDVSRVVEESVPKGQEYERLDNQIFQHFRK